MRPKAAGARELHMAGWVPGHTLETRSNDGFPTDIVLKGIEGRLVMQITARATD